MGNIGKPLRRIEVLPDAAPTPGATPEPDRTTPAPSQPAQPPGEPVRQ